MQKTAAWPGSRHMRPTGTRGVSSGDIHGVDGTRGCGHPRQPAHQGVPALPHPVPSQRLRPPVSFPPTFPRGLPTQTSMRRGHGLDGNLGHGRARVPRGEASAAGIAVLPAACALSPRAGTFRGRLSRRLPFSHPPAEAGPPRLRAPVAQRRCEMGAFGSSEARSWEWGRRRARSSEPSGGFGRRAHGTDPARPRVWSGLTFEACAADSGQTGKAGSPSGEGSS